MPVFSDFLRGSDPVILTEAETRQWDAVMAGESFAEMIADETLFPRDTFFIGFVCDSDMGIVDIAGWNFSGANLSGADMSKVQNITKAIFDTKTRLDTTKLPPGITTEILIR